MKKLPKIYLDTSVIGGCLDEVFSKWSLQLIREIEMGLFIPFVSVLTEAELSNAPDDVVEIFGKILKLGCNVLQGTEEAFELAMEYVKHKIISERFINDCTHIAIATVNNLDLLTSWNFRHIVNYEKITKFNAVNLEMGYKTVEIRSPREVIHYEIS